MFEYILNSPRAVEDMADFRPGDPNYIRQPVSFQYESMPIVGSMVKAGYPWCTVTLPEGTRAQGHDLSGLSFLMYRPQREHAATDVIACEVPCSKTWRSSGNVEQLSIKMFTCDEHGQMTSTVEISTSLLASACRQVVVPEAARARALEMSRDRAAMAKSGILAATPDRQAPFDRASEPRRGGLASSKADAMFARAKAETAPRGVATADMRQAAGASLKQVVGR